MDINIENFCKRFIDDYNHEHQSELELLDFERTDLFIDESLKYNFIYIRMHLSDNSSKELIWYFKLVPIEYFSDSINYMYLPIGNSPKVYNFTVQLENKELSYDILPQFN